MRLLGLGLGFRVPAVCYYTSGFVVKFRGVLGRDLDGWSGL